MSTEEKAAADLPWKYREAWRIKPGWWVSSDDEWTEVRMILHMTASRTREKYLEIRTTHFHDRVYRNDELRTLTSAEGKRAGLKSADAYPLVSVLGGDA